MFKFKSNHDLIIINFRELEGTLNEKFSPFPRFALEVTHLFLIFLSSFIFHIILHVSQLSLLKGILCIFSYICSYFLCNITFRYHFLSSLPNYLNYDYFTFLFVILCCYLLCLDSFIEDDPLTFIFHYQTFFRNNVYFHFSCLSI